jgi:hypothetical protein
MDKSIYSLMLGEKKFRLGGHVSPSIYIPYNSLTRNSTTVFVPSFASHAYPKQKEKIQTYSIFRNVAKLHNFFRKYCFSFHWEFLVLLVGEKYIMRSFIACILRQI